MSTEVGDEIRKSVMGENIDFENQEICQHSPLLRRDSGRQVREVGHAHHQVGLNLRSPNIASLSLQSIIYQT